MKRIALVIFVIFFLQLHATQAQEKAQSDPTSIVRSTVWDIPRTDSFLLFKSFRPVLAYTGRKPIYILANNELFDLILVHHTKDSIDSEPLPEGLYLGLDFAVDYLEDYSLFSAKELKAIQDPDKRMVAEAFNKKAKYTVVAESPYVVYGVKERLSDGSIVMRQLLDHEVTAYLNGTYFTDKATVGKQNPPVPPKDDVANKNKVDEKKKAPNMLQRSKIRESMKREN